jgi:hypothetical protein
MTNSKTIATVRTALPAAWTTAIVYLAARFGLDLSEQDMAVLLLVVPVVLPIFYRIAREIELKYPTIGRVIFGTNATPSYGDAEEGRV